MHRMFKDAGDNDAVKEEIRRTRLHGIELQDKLFAIGTTNMILRGDGKPPQLGTTRSVSNRERGATFSSARLVP